MNSPTLLPETEIKKYESLTAINTITETELRVLVQTVLKRGLTILVLTSNQKIKNIKHTQIVVRDRLSDFLSNRLLKLQTTNNFVFGGHLGLIIFLDSANTRVLRRFGTVHYVPSIMWVNKEETYATNYVSFSTLTESEKIILLKTWVSSIETTFPARRRWRIVVKRPKRFFFKIFSKPIITRRSYKRIKRRGLFTKLFSFYFDRSKKKKTQFKKNKLKNKNKKQKTKK